jgi:hypothetical protein
MVTFMTQTLHHLYSLALLLSLSLIHKRLRSYGTLAIVLGLKLTNYSIVLSLGTHVTFSQTLSLSLHHLLLSLFQTLKQSLSSLPYARTYIRDRRLQIQTALLFKIPWAQIKEILDVSDSQITHAKTHRLIPQKTKAGRYAKLYIPEKTILKEWLLSSPSYRHMAYHKILYFLPQLHAGKKAIRIAIDGINYYYRVLRKKGFSDNPKVCQERLDLAEDGSTWPRLRV